MDFFWNVLYIYTVKFKINIIVNPSVSGSMVCVDHWFISIIFNSKTMLIQSYENNDSEKNKFI